MSNGLAISGVTAVLQYYLFNLFSAPGSPFTTPVTVSCLAPDQVQSSMGGTSEPENQVNLFLHQVTHNAAWRNADLPSMGPDGKTRLKSPPLALDLHYLLTVYGSEYWQAEALLGFAVMMFHESPILARSDISNALTKLSTAPEPFPGNPFTPFLGSSGLADQVEMIKITPATLGREEMAWLWTALKADYRPTFPFQVSVVLLQPKRATSLALPVLSRSVAATPIQPAAVLSVAPGGGQPAALSADVVTVSGEFLAGVTQVLLTNARFGTQYTVPVTSPSNGSFTFVPNAALTHPVGIYQLTAQFLDSSGNAVQSTTPVPFGLAATLPTQVASVTPNPEGSLVKVSFTPNIVEGQDVALILSSLTAPPPPTPIFTSSVTAEPFTGSTASLDFQFPPGLPAGALLGRLVVDGVVSPVQVNMLVTPPVFTGPFVTV